MRTHLALQVSANRIQSIDGDALGRRVLRRDLVKQVRQEFQVEMAELGLNVEYDRNQAFEILLVRSEMLGFDHMLHPRRDLWELVKEYLIRAVDDDLGQATECALLYRFAPGLIHDRMRKHFEMLLKGQQLLFTLDVGQDVPLELTNGLGDHRVNFVVGFIFQLLHEVVHNPR